MRYFSVHELNFRKKFELYSTEDDPWPAHISNENFIGRKCFEFAWIDGDKRFCVGIQSASTGSSAFFYGGNGNEVFKSRDTTGDNTNDIVKPLQVHFSKNARYGMF